MPSGWQNLVLVLIGSYILSAFLGWFAQVTLRYFYPPKKEYPRRPSLVHAVSATSFFGLLLLVGDPDFKLDGTQLLAHENTLNALLIGFLISLIFLCCRLAGVWFHRVRENISFEHENNIEERKRLTRLQFLEKMTYGVIAIVGISAIFLSIEPLEKLGTSLLASAGVAGVIIGFAAQESMGNLVAGFQVAFTQPFRIDDAVVVEGEWGWIEEINFTYIVVRLWDRRRLVVPIKQFVQSSFQNWTKNGAQIIGVIEVYVDYATDVDDLRQKYTDIVRASKLWDGDVCVLQVTDATEKTMKIRGLASAKNSPTAWDLRCEIREKIIKYLQEKHPHALPQLRANLHNVSTDQPRF